MSMNHFQTRVSEYSDTHPNPIQNFEHWVQYWNEEESDLANLRNFHHWLERAQQRIKPNSLTRRGSHSG